MDRYGYIGIETLLNYCENSKDHVVTPNDFMRMNRVRNISCSEFPNNWIPCSERLPEVNDTYLVCYENASVLMDWFNGHWFFYRTNPAVEETGTVTAWMPLPDPYQEEGEHE